MPHHALRQLSSSHYHLPMERAAAARFTAALARGARKMSGVLSRPRVPTADLFQLTR